MNIESISFIRKLRQENEMHNSWSPLMLAVFFKNIEQIQTSISEGVDVNERGRRKVTPLHEAAVNTCMSFLGVKGGSCLDACTLLIGNGAELDAQDEDGLTPLMYATLDGQQEVAELLIRDGAHLNKIDGEGGTTLHYAAKYGQKEILELLIANDAELNIRDYFGQTPLDDVGDYREIISLLVKSGCKKATQLDSV
mgnify:CR=1 FL=1